MAYNTPAMEPRIQYCKTSDGVNIAYASMGEGPPLVRMPEIAGASLIRDRPQPGVPLTQICIIPGTGVGLMGLSQPEPNYPESLTHHIW